MTVFLSFVTSAFSYPFSSHDKSFQEALLDATLNSSHLDAILENDSSLANQQLPNGEYPLHTLVRENQNREMQLGKLEVLLNRGADIGLKDAQGLTALDHAALLKDQSLLIRMLGRSIGKDLNEIQAQMELPDDMENIENILLDQQIHNNVKVNELSPIEMAAYQGDLSTFSVQEMVAALPNTRGETTLHFAIKGKQIDLVKNIIDEMKRSCLEINLLDVYQNSLLHYAVTIDTPEIVHYLIDAGLLIDQRNVRGETPLHFAAATNHPHLMQVLVKKGANLKVVDAGGRSPLVLYAQLTKSKDLLAIDEMQITLAAVTALYWLGQVAQNSGWAIPFQEIIMPTLFLAVSTFELNHLLANLNANWKKITIFIGYFTLGFFPPFNLCYQLCKISYVSKDLFSSLGVAWKNIRYRKWDAVCKLTVSGINTTFAVNSLYKSYQSNKYWYDLFISCKNSDSFAQIQALLIYLKEGNLSVFDDFPDLKDKVEVIFIKWKYEDLSAFKDILELVELITGHAFNYQYDSSSLVPEKCDKIEKNVLDLFGINRINDTSLEPSCVEHAATIISTNFDLTSSPIDFDKKLFCEEASSASSERHLKYLNKLWRNLSIHLHPDKNSDFKEVFMKASQAKETLVNKWRNYCNL